MIIILLSLYIFYIAFVNIFPPLYSIGYNMKDNLHQWGKRRLLELTPTDPPSEKPEEYKKLEERLGKWSEKMNFLDILQKLPIRRNSNR